MFELVLLFIILLSFSAFFSGSETALFSLSKVQIHKFRESRNRRSSRNLIACLRKPRDILVTILLGNELVNISMSIVGAAMASKLIRNGVETETIVTVAIVTPLVLIFGDIIPKNISLRYSNQLAQIFIWPLYIIYRAIWPIRVFLTWISDLMLRLFKGHPGRAEAMIMEEEYKKLVDLGKKEGVIVEEERELIHNVFEFSDKVVSDIVAPSERIFSIPIDLPYEQIMEEIGSTQYSRVPFYEGSMENIVGILHVRDLLSFHRRKSADPSLSIRDQLKPASFVDPRTPLEKLLREFQRARMHMAIVRDDAGAILGVVTMDDVLEELFGEIEE